MKAVLNTNVLVSGLRSRLGASFQLIDRIVKKQILPAVTTSLVVEYESVLLRPDLLPDTLSRTDIAAFLDWYVSSSTKHRVHYLWRPNLPDPKDDLVLEAAMASRSPYLVTFNRRDFPGAADLGIVVLTPSQLLKHLKP